MLPKLASDRIRVRRHGTLVRSAFVLSSVVAAGCKGETSAITNPDPPACRFEVAPAAQVVSSSQASGTITVATSNTCPWTATTDVAWITLTQSTSGSGNGSVNFAVAFNGGFQRIGSVLIGGQPSTITQAGSTGTNACIYTIDPGSQLVAAAGAASTAVGVTTTFGCLWTATSNAPWIVVTAGASGNGNGVVVASVAENTGAARTGTLTIAGGIATITQAAAGAAAPEPVQTACAYTVSPSSNGIPPLGGGGHLAQVTTRGTCPWTAKSNDAWITITAGASGMGNGVVTYAGSGNFTGASRRGTLTVAGLTVAITQGIPGPLPQ